MLKLIKTHSQRFIIIKVYIKMNRDLLIQERQRIIGEEATKYNKQNMSFQERDFYHIDSLKLQLIDQLIFISENDNMTQPSQNKLINSIATKYKQYITSLLTFSSDIISLVTSSPLISFPHQHHSSQSTLLALILTKIENKSVILISHSSQISKICQFFADDTQLDTVGYVKNGLQEQGVQFIQMKAIPTESLVIDEKNIVILDVFGLDPTQYYLTLGRSYQKLLKASHVILYHSTLQNADVDNFLKIVNKSNKNMNLLSLELAPPHPIQIHSCEEPQQLLNEVFNFLESISRYSQKQDIIIFFPLNSPLFSYIKHLKQELVKNNLKQSVNLITSAHQKLTRQKSNIYFVKSNSQLKQWGYNYSNVFMVVDYGYQYTFSFDYSTGCHIEKILSVSVPEKCQRINWIGADRGGKYFYYHQQNIISSHYLQSSFDISGYLLQAIHYKQLDFINLQHHRALSCLQFLQFIGVIQILSQNTYQIIDQRYLQYAQLGISPINTKMMLAVTNDTQLIGKNQQKYLNLMAMTIAIVNSQGSLRKIKQELEGSHIKPYAVWRKSGYLESCLEIITKCQLIQSRKHPNNSKSQQFRRRASKKMSNHFQVFQKQQNRRKKNFEDMDVTDLIIDYTVNEDLLHHIRDRVEQLRYIFEFEMIPILLQKENVNKILSYWLLSSSKESIGIYSGSKSSQYFTKNENLFLNEQCLFYVLHQRPQLVKILRMSQIQNKKTILFANSLHKQTYIEHFGKIPTLQVISHHNKNLEEESKNNQQQIKPEVIKQFAFQGIGSAVLEQLVKDNGKKIEEFQQENNCHLSFNMELGAIRLICFKDQIDNKNYVKQNLNCLIKKVTQLCQFYTKKLHYLGILNFILGQGGKIIEVTDSNHTTRCLLKNLPPEIAKEYIEVVLQDYHLKSIEVMEVDQLTQKTSAVIQFYSKQTYQQFLRDYQNNLARQNYFTVETLKQNEYQTLKKQQSLQFGSIRSSLIFKWFTWKSHGKGQIIFKSADSVSTTIEAFKINPTLDYSQVIVKADPKNKKIVNIENLNIHTDEIYIEQALRNYGDIQSVQILKTPLKQTLGDHEHIGFLLKSALDRKDPIKYKVVSIDKKEHGLRVGKVIIDQIHKINHICQKLNRNTKVFGQGRLYVQPIYERQILIPQGCIEIYTQLFEQLKSSLQKDKPKIKIQIRQHQQNIYMVVISPIQQTLLFFLSKLKQKFTGVKVDYPLQAKTVIMNQIGIANFLDMEEKYNCKFIVSIYSAKIRVIAKQSHLKSIAQEVKDRIHHHFFYKVNLTSKNYKHYQNNPDLLTQLQKQFQLTLTELQQDNFSLLLQGSAISIKDAIVWIHTKVKNEGKSIEGQQVNLCGICYENSEDSYRLFCSHRFCRECLLDYLRYSLGDMSMFPLRCPSSECRQFISCIDLEHLFQQFQWYKMRTLTANQFLKTNDNYNYCMTPGCEQINRIQNTTMDGVYAEFMRCDICKNSYCLKCNQQYHPARTCSQAKISQDVLLKKYITDQGVRKCVGKKCQALVMRYTGCFKVQCSRCSTCMCFKCPPDQMQAFDTPRECYDHLTNQHGGYY